MLFQVEKTEQCRCTLCDAILEHKTSIARGQCTALASCAKRRAARGVNKNEKRFLRNQNEKNTRHMTGEKNPDTSHYTIGDAVEYHFCDHPNSWYPGVITKIGAEGDVDIDFYDGDSYTDLPIYEKISSGMNMVRRIDKKESKTEIPRCTRCGRIFKNALGLKIHLAACRSHNAHGKNAKNRGIPRCATCGRVFKSMKGLSIHCGHTGCPQEPKTVTNTTERQKVTQLTRCATCDRTFETMRGLKIHRSHGCPDKKVRGMGKQSHPDGCEYIVRELVRAHVLGHVLGHVYDVGS